MLDETVWTDHGIEWRMSGVVDLSEINEANAKFSGDPRSDKARYQLADLSEVTELRASDEEMRYVGAYDAAQSLSTPRIRLAFVVANDRVLRKLQPYLEMARKGVWLIEVFGDVAAARAWALSDDRGRRTARRSAG